VGLRVVLRGLHRGELPAARITSNFHLHAPSATRHGELSTCPYQLGPHARAMILLPTADHHSGLPKSGGTLFPVGAKGPLVGPFAFQGHWFLSQCPHTISSEP
jgi:hypothetical protein